MIMSKLHKGRSRMEKDRYRKSRILYIIEAALEYFIAILTQGTFFAKLATAVGIPDTLTNVLSSLVTLACSFRIIAVFLAGKRHVKGYVTVLHSINQLCFVLFYLIPTISLPHRAKIIGFVILYLGGNILSQIVFSPKYNWFMSLVDVHKRGSFTATKEIVSLLSSMIFTLGMGKIIDIFEEAGNIRAAFVAISVTILVLTLLHTATLVFSDEKKNPGIRSGTRSSFSSLLKSKNLLPVIAIPLFYTTTIGASLAFFPTYWNNDLGFSMTFNSVLAAALAISRALFSRPFGKFADKYSFAKLLTVCYTIQSVALLVCVFAVPSNGPVLCMIHNILNGIAMAGINSGNVNIIYDYIEPENRVGAIAISGTVSGIVGFLATLLMAIPVEYIRANGNTLFGLPVYAQQVVSAVGSLLALGIVLYIQFFIKKLSPVSDSDTEEA